MNMSESRESPFRLELFAVEGSERYLIHSRIEILFILRAIMQRNMLVTLCFNQGTDRILTSVLDVDAERGRMIVDYGRNEELNVKALMAQELAFITSLDQVKIQFVSHGIERIQFEGRSTFSVSTPECLLRMQRREYYRIAAPAIHPPKCTIPLPAVHGAAELDLMDISCGGIAVIDYDPTSEFTPGATYETCRIILPDVGTLNVALRVKSTFEATLKNGLTRRRTGCEFIAMPENMLAVIQRYIFKLERERKARQTRLK